MKLTHHQGLTTEKWNELSLPKQLLHVGSELSRAISAKRIGSTVQEERAYERALELLDLTLAGPRSLAEFRELARLREAIGSLLVKGELTVSAAGLYEYILKFSALK